MKNFVKRTGFLALALLLVSCLAFGAVAAEFVKWEMSDDTTTLTGDGIVYTRYDTFIMFNEDAETVYEYSQNLNYNDYLSSSYVQTPYKGADFVWIYNDYYEPVIYYASEDAKASFDR
ncbi:MAG: hypothetical protein IJN48_04880, partial [Clostridia bacterium]|nr:hypothetical protein [Clostridia bacterium]